jgi:hypothetical protein
MSIRNIAAPVLLAATLFLGAACAGGGDEEASEKPPDEPLAEGTTGGQEEHDHDQSLVLGEPPPMLPGGYRDLPPEEKEKLARLDLSVDTFDRDYGGRMADDHFELEYPFTPAGKLPGVAFFELTGPAYEAVRDKLGLVPEDRVKLRGVTTMEEYNMATRKEWWDYGDIHEERITFEPIPILFQRGLAPIALAHEYAKYMMQKTAGEELPLWMLEGFASLAADEGPVLRNQLRVRVGNEEDFDPVMTPEEVEETLGNVYEMDVCRIAYYNAFLMARKVQEEFGWETVALVFPTLRETGSVEETSRVVFGMEYEELLDWVEVGMADIEFVY